MRKSKNVFSCEENFLGFNGVQARANTGGDALQEFFFVMKAF